MIDVPTTEKPARRARLRGDLLAAGFVVCLVAAAFLVREAVPLYGVWKPHSSGASVFVVVLAAAVVLWGPTLAQRLSWGRLLSLGYVTSLAWITGLALVDGWRRGFTGRLDTPHEYLHEVSRVTDIPAMLEVFADRIVSGQPGYWTTHVAGHPPGALLVFVWLDRLGLSGGAAAAIVCVLASAVVAVAVPVTLAALGRSDAARACWPFVVLFPGAVWMGVSADGLFAGVTTAGIALLALATRSFQRRTRGGAALAVGAGVLLGFGIFLSYGLVLLGTVALGVVLAGRSLPALMWAVLGALAVVGIFALAGFWWFEGYQLVVERYYQGIASERSYSYWVWANFACLACAVGPAVAVGMRRSRKWTPVVALAGAALLAIVFADVSGLSKAEVERIWLPFAVWLLPVTALLPAGSRRWWLAAQATTALVVNHLVLTVW